MISGRSIGLNVILILGGIGQGKKDFAGKQFPELAGKTAVDGKTASWEEFLKADYAVNVQEMIWRCLDEGERAEELERDMALELMEACPERVLITDEIGYGIVPIDAFLRDYREVTGRICCQLAKEAREVWRVTAGIGQRIK